MKTKSINPAKSFANELAIELMHYHQQHPDIYPAPDHWKFWKEISLSLSHRSCMALLAGESLFAIQYALEHQIANDIVSYLQHKSICDLYINQSSGAPGK